MIKMFSFFSLVFRVLNQFVFQKRFLFILWTAATAYPAPIVHRAQTLKFLTCKDLLFGNRVLFMGSSLNPIVFLTCTYCISLVALEDALARAKKNSDARTQSHLQTQINDIQKIIAPYLVGLSVSDFMTKNTDLITKLTELSIEKQDQKKESFIPSEKDF